MEDTGESVEEDFGETVSFSSQAEDEFSLNMQSRSTSTPQKNSSPVKACEISAKMESSESSFCNNVSSIEGTSNEQLDVTLKSLRGKKIRKLNINEAELREAIRQIVTEMKEDISIKSLVSERGIIAITPIRRRLPSDMKGASIKMIREIVKSLI